MSAKNNKRRVNSKRLDGVEAARLREWFQKVELPSAALKTALKALGDQAEKVEQHLKRKPGERAARGARTKRRATDDGA